MCSCRELFIINWLICTELTLTVTYFIHRWYIDYILGLVTLLAVSVTGYAMWPTMQHHDWS